MYRVYSGFVHPYGWLYSSGYDLMTGLLDGRPEVVWYQNIEKNIYSKYCMYVGVDDWKQIGNLEMRELLEKYTGKIIFQTLGDGRNGQTVHACFNCEFCSLHHM
jgi:hypothetical protein